MERAIMKKGFTLIELLIVVAIIAILAAIAVPNFLEAQTRAKVSRGKADMRSVVTALESYKIDTNAYPSDTGNGVAIGGVAMYRATNPRNSPPAQYTLGWELSTPVAYLSSLNGVKDPFRAGKESKYALGTSLYGRQNYGYVNNELRAKLAKNVGGATETILGNKVNWYGPYILAAAGPDGLINNGNMEDDYKPTAAFPAAPNYDSTNGTVSIGDIYRSASFTDGNLKIMP